MADNIKIEFFADTVKELYKGYGYSDVKVIFDNQGRQCGVNNLGDIIKVKVEGVRDKRVEKKNLIIKAVPDEQLLRIQSKVDLRFHTEVLVYQNILPLMDDLQVKFNIKDKFNYCNVLKVHTNDFKEMMLMEDLSENGFEPIRIKKSININDFEHVSNVLEKIGKLHALSLALEKYAPGVLEKTLSFTDDITNDKASPYFLNFATETAINHIEDPIAKKKMSDFMGLNIYEYVRSMVGSKVAAPYAVLVHSDVWTNNIMFKYDDTKLVDSIMIDWQIVRHHSPAFDLLFFLFTSVDDHFRGPNFQKCLDLYYSTLRDFLTELGCDPDDIFPRKAFCDQLRKFTKFTLAMVLFAVQVFLGRGFDLSQINLDDFYNSPGLPQPTDAYVKRVNAIVTDLIYHGML